MLSGMKFSITGTPNSHALTKCLCINIIIVPCIVASTVQDGIETARKTGKTLIEKYDDKLKKYEVKLHSAFFLSFFRSLFLSLSLSLSLFLPFFFMNPQFF